MGVGLKRKLMNILPLTGPSPLPASSAILIGTLCHHRASGCLAKGEPHSATESNLPSIYLILYSPQKTRAEHSYIWLQQWLLASCSGELPSREFHKEWHSSPPLKCSVFPMTKGILTKTAAPCCKLPRHIDLTRIKKLIICLQLATIMWSTIGKPVPVF